MKFKSTWMFHYLFLLIRFLLDLKCILGHVFIVYDCCASAIPPASINFCSLLGQLHLNTPFSNSHGWTGSSMKWRLMRANLFKFKLICPH